MSSTEFADTAELKTAVIGSHVPRHIYDELEALAKQNFRTVSSEARLAIMKHLADAKRG